MKNLQTLIDKSAIGLSFLCVLHCLLLPIAVTLLPVMAALPLEDEGFHQLLLWGILPTSVIALTLGFRLHKNWRVLFWGAVGLFLLILSALFGHQLLGSEGEKLVTLIGTGFIIYSHVKNYKLFHANRCEC